MTRAAGGGDFDYPRARAGGLDLPFMSIYTPAELEAEGGAWQLANQLIDSMEALVARAPDKFPHRHHASRGAGGEGCRPDRAGAGHGERLAD